MDIIYDCEVFPNCFLLCAKNVADGQNISFEVSDRRDDSRALTEWLIMLKTRNYRMVGFNNVGFDYVLLHDFINGARSPQELYEKTKAIIESENKFAHIIWPDQRYIPQVDLMKIHHFDNKARMTSLKTLEFNMRLNNISDLPFSPGTKLTGDQIDVLTAYCFDDVEATFEFYKKTSEQIHFREKLTEKYQRDFMNHSDVKIGKEIFQISLERAGVECYDRATRKPKQTLRDRICLGECVPQFVSFDHPELNKIKQHFLTTTITETKGAFDELVAKVEGLEFKFGTGGLHASVENESFVASDDMMIYDVDVTSLYPSIAIEHGHFPQHLGKTFVEVYSNLKKQRLTYAKGTPENAMLKLALNGVYGASNDKYTCFYDPLFTMKITVSGQLMIVMLAEQLLSVANVRIIQCNTDGITLYFPRSAKIIVDAVCQRWEQITKLSLEYVEYVQMHVADVNSYIAKKPSGELKRKGRYEYKVEWHQNASALVVPKVAEKVLLDGAPIMETLANWPDNMDFMLRAKANKGTRLVLAGDEGDYDLDRTQRYYIAEGGKRMFKIMPPLAKKPKEFRRIAVQSGWGVQPCNDMACATLPIDYRWYASEVDKLVLGVM